MRKVYCDKCLLPEQFRNLTTYDNRSTVPPAPPQTNVVRLKFDPTISSPTCEAVTMRTSTQPTEDQPYLVYWVGSTAVRFVGQRFFLFF